MSALAWRVCTRERGGSKDDPTIVRHIHDLAALEPRALASRALVGLLREAAAADTGRAGGRAPADVNKRFVLMLELLRSDPLWADEYRAFVRDKSFAAPDDAMSFETALQSVERLVETWAREEQ